jgi:hypothetical protein
MRVPVDRSSEGAAEARRGQARAFTSNRAVVIPTEVGSLETGPGAALFAHELTHVAQRARLGRDLPAESSPAGRLLESEALSAELALATGRSSPLEWPDAGGPPLGSRRAGAGPVLPGSHAAGALPLAGAAAGAPDIESLAASILDKMSVLSSPQSGAETTQVFTAPWSAGPAPAPAPAAPVQRAEQPAAAPASAPAGATAPDEQASPFGSRPSDQELNNLSRWLYPLIKYRLKGELREDRERAGLLTDHYRKW